MGCFLNEQLRFQEILFFQLFIKKTPQMKTEFGVKQNYHASHTHLKPPQTNGVFF